MGSKQTVEEFINDCFRERTQALRRCRQVWEVYWRHYCHPDCLWDSGRWSIELSQAEEIVSVSQWDGEVAVITTGRTFNRSRYHVRPEGESWLIREVDFDCAWCKDSGTPGCERCGGEGWTEYEEYTRSQRPENVTQNTGRIKGVETAHPAIMKFMAEYFRERTESWRKEAEIYGEFAKDFFSPKFAWRRWAKSVEGSQNETITNVVTGHWGAHVFTDGFMGLRLRYQLRLNGRSWQIREVDPECLVCFQTGRNANCFWCGGTIWEHKKIRSESRRGSIGVFPEKPRWEP